jgi:predicted AlkP superfamily phosphohydrolase/phosphomutase
MITTTQSTTYNLTLTAEQFDDLYEVLDETIGQISEAIEDTDLTLNDYELYKVWQQFNRFKGG